MCFNPNSLPNQATAFTITDPSEQVLVPTTSGGCPPPTFPGRPLKILLDHTGDVPI